MRRPTASAGRALARPRALRPQLKRDPLGSGNSHLLWAMRRTIVAAELITVLAIGALSYSIFSQALPGFWMWSDWLIEVVLALLAAWASWKGRMWAPKAAIVAAAFIGIVHPSWVPWRMEAALSSETLSNALSYLWLLIVAIAQLVALVSALRQLRPDVPAA